MRGVCRFCGCTELEPCVDPFDKDLGPHPCFWINDDEDVCSSCRYHPIAVRPPGFHEIVANYPGLVLTTRGTVVPVTSIRRYNE